MAPNARQLAALRQNAPKVEDLLENDAYLEELNEEIRNSYPQEDEVVELPKQKIAPRVTQRKVTEEVSDPDAELAAMEKRTKEILAQRAREEQAKAKAAKEEEEVSPEEAIQAQILSALKNNKNAPNDAMIAQWKAQKGANGVYVTAFNETDVYVYTYLRRAEWLKLQSALTNAAKVNPELNTDEEMKLKVLQYCMLWPRITVEFFHNARAGILDTLFNVIMAHSGFLQLNQAMILTTQL